uniref:Uncharacterized protein MANES_17G058200 n=1 Tax=Rhizophora mucronata TaxID=61149 RepID=A0A2P2PJD3_RHIMU
MESSSMAFLRLPISQNSLIFGLKSVNLQSLTPMTDTEGMGVTAWQQDDKFDGKRFEILHGFLTKKTL